MRIEFTSEQENAQAAIRRFVQEKVAVQADSWDREERIPDEVIEALGAEGCFGAAVPEEYGGGAMDMISYGLLHAEIGRGCSSLRSILTVHGMVACALLRWGSHEQKSRWLPGMAAGRVIAGFALSEPGVGSDANAVETTAERVGGFYVLNGRKSWITAGQIADLFLVFAQSDGKSVAFLVEKDSAGLSRRPIRGMLGMRASMLAELELQDCRVPERNMLGKPGFGFSHVAATALHDGRYTVAWGCVGIAQACLEASVRYASERRQFGAYLREHQLVQRMITDMVVGVRAARLLCCEAGYTRQTGHPRAVTDTAIAKYFASTSLSKIAHDAVQLHGAVGCSGQSPVQRYLRDATILEIIEGSTQIQQVLIARHAHIYAFDPMRPHAATSCPEPHQC